MFKLIGAIAAGVLGLTATANAQNYPNRPIQLIMLGYGAADIKAMNALTSTVGGSVYHIDSPTQIVGAFVDAISHSVLLSLGESTAVGSAS